MNKENTTKELQKRLYFVFAWFTLSLVAGVLTLGNISFIAITLICLTFLIFNVFTTLYNLIIFTTQRLIREETNCRSQKHSRQS